MCDIGIPSLLVGHVRRRPTPCAARARSVDLPQTTLRDIRCPDHAVSKLPVDPVADHGAPD